MDMDIIRLPASSPGKLSTLLPIRSVFRTRLTLDCCHGSRRNSTSATFADLEPILVPTKITRCDLIPEKSIQSWECRMCNSPCWVYATSFLKEPADGRLILGRVTHITSSWIRFCRLMFFP